MVDETLCMIAALACRNVYEKSIKIMTTEYAITRARYNLESIDVLAFAGTNEPLDWFLNIFPFTMDGIKLGSHLSVERVANRFQKNPARKLLVCGHSKSGTDAMKWKEKYGADWCIVFCPAPGYKKAVKLENTVMFIDLDDFVPNAGRFLFCHPECYIVHMPKNRRWWNIFGRVKDHFMESVIAYLQSNKGALKVWKM